MAFDRMSTTKSAVNITANLLTHLNCRTQYSIDIHNILIIPNIVWYLNGQWPNYFIELFTICLSTVN